MRIKPRLSYSEQASQQFGEEIGCVASKIDRPAQTKVMAALISALSSHNS